MECPTCGKILNTTRGMRQHHTKVHGDPLPNRACSGCKTRFYDPKARREYCDDCNPNAGKHNGNWKNASETTVCKTCETEFDYYPSDKKGTYCSTCVEKADGLLPEHYTEKVERVKVACPACEKERTVLPSIVENNKRGVFCDLDCYGAWLSENIVGEDHHMWKGANPEYAYGWSKIQRAARVRDGYQCRVCGVTKSELGRNPDVHHIKPVREFEHPRDAHDMENVISLCPSCHSKAEAGAICLPAPNRK